MNILLLASHAVAEYDDIRMFHDLGYEVFCPGGYEDPAKSGEGIRPPLHQVPRHDHLIDACREQREKLGDPGPWIDWAKAQLHPDVIDWADVIIAHHFVDRWLVPQWDRIKHKRVIWRTCGQSNPELERFMTPLVDDGLQVVRYSPAEERYFGNLGSFAGQHALIRFGKYPADYGPWVGDNLVVGNITQHMQQRGDACGYPFWEAATAGLPAQPAGPGSEVLRGGIGSLPYEAMLDYLRHLRVYLYTGTRPASYTLGLIEAMMSGVPVVYMGPAHFDPPELQEGMGSDGPFDDPAKAREKLQHYLDDAECAARAGRLARDRAISLFGVEMVGAQWKAFLS